MIDSTVTISNVNNQDFIVIPEMLIDKVQPVTYSFTYTLNDVRDPLVFASFSFEIIVILKDPCTRPKSLVAKTPLLNQEYAIGQPRKTRSVEFVTDPAECQVTYNITSNNPKAFEVIQFDLAQL